MDQQTNHLWHCTVNNMESQRKQAPSACPTKRRKLKTQQKVLHILTGAAEINQLWNKLHKPKKQQLSNALEILILIQKWINKYYSQHKPIKVPKMPQWCKVTSMPEKYITKQSQTVSQRAKTDQEKTKTAVVQSVDADSRPYKYLVPKIHKQKYCY